MKIVALAGGVGGAKLVHGLSKVLPAEDLTVIVNTGDDFTHLGLKVCPDIDTICYTLAEVANPATGWGRDAETWNVISEMEKLGAPTWFRLGDKDIAYHLERTRLASEGKKLSQIVEKICAIWSIGVKVLPMTDDVVSTHVITDTGEDLAFQDYFVKFGCSPKVKEFRFDGMESAKPAFGVIESIREADFIIICPSNPFVSIEPILKVNGIREAIGAKKVLAVSPI
ncbi:MAG: 2-phospho-L-lactate transferase, partial [Anaerolineaceae bacterium]|nr:2-phospho-L-lactate transferase [Anaerolineaceae bacterium]